MTTGAIRAAGDLLGRRDAVQARHLDVEDDEVGPVLGGQRDGRSPSPASPTTR